MLKHKHLICVQFALLLLCFSTLANATVLKGITQNIKTDAKPLDIVVAGASQNTFVLLEGGIVQIIGANGISQGTIEVSKSVVSISVSPNGDRLFLADRNNSFITVVPLDYIVDLNIKGSPFKGPVDAPVVVVEFSDFQCPYCAKIQPLLEQVLKLYPNDVKLVYKNFPIAKLHKFAYKAAVAALAAGEQGKYWEYHDLLFKVYNRINDARIVAIATELGLNMEKFKQDLTKKKFLNLVNNDYREGANAGVRGTPAIYVNGRHLKDRSLLGFKTIINSELKKISGTK